MSGEKGIVVSARASERLGRAVSWLLERPEDQRVFVIAPGRHAGQELLREAAGRGGGSFGHEALASDELARRFAARGLAERGLVPASGLLLESVVARALLDHQEREALGRFASVAETPGLARAITRSLVELRLAGVDPSALDEVLGSLARAFAEGLQQAGLADRAAVLQEAARVVNEEPERAAPALLLVDPRPRFAAEWEWLAALLNASEQALVLQPRGSLELTRFESLLGVTAERLKPEEETTLGRLQERLFRGGEAAEASSDASLHVFSAPGESRECVEIARGVHEAAGRGVPFDRMAVLLRSERAYRPLLVESLRRAGIPCWFAEGTTAPDPDGRAFLALLLCAEEGLSARRFAEYLSLGTLPAPMPDGSPPPAWSREERFIPPDAELPEEDEDELGVTPPAPRRWEKLLVEAAVIGGADRWRRRLEGLDRELERRRGEAEEESTTAGWLERQRSDLQGLRAFALPLLDLLAAWPETASWSAWLDELAALATRALRRPERVLMLLSELEPLGSVGAVSLPELRHLLEPRLRELQKLPTERPFGRVFVGPVEAAAGLHFDEVWIPGLCERVFPQKVVEDPILLDASRADLDAALPTNVERRREERLRLHLAVGAASARVSASWSRFDLEQARPRVPSFYALEVVRAAEGRLPAYQELARRASAGADAHLGWPAPEDPRQAIDAAEHDVALLRRSFEQDAEGAAGVGRYLMDSNPHLARALRTRYQRWAPRWSRADGLLEPGDAAKKALEAHHLDRRSFSPTRLQGFGECPYRFFLGGLLGLETRPEAEAIERVDPLVRGSMLHEIQERILIALRDTERLPVRPEALPAIFVELDALAAEVTESWKDDLCPAIERVWQDEVEEIRADLREWMRRVAEDSTWVPRHFELSFGLSRSKEEAHRDPVPLDCGLQLRGAIDLVEENAQGELRITDHKSGRVWAKTGVRIGGGTVLQPLLYALAAEKLFPGAKVVEGRLFYCTSRGDFSERSVPLDDDGRLAIQGFAKLVKSWIETGTFPAAPRRGACRLCDFRLVCGPHEELRVSRKDGAHLDPLNRLREQR